MAKLFAGRPQKGGAKKRKTAPAAAAEEATDVAAADEALQTLKELEDLVIESGARIEGRRCRRWSLFGGDKTKAKKRPARSAAERAPGGSSGADTTDRGGREQLIRDALAIQREKQAALSNLSDEQRALLREMAQKLLDAADPGKGNP